MNAKGELIQHTNYIMTYHPNSVKVKCAYIESLLYLQENRKHELGCYYNEEEYTQFLNSLDFEYDAGYGTQELYGTIWYEDGTWSTRWEYDGSEGWEYNKCPDIPNDLIRVDRMRDIKISKLIE